MYQLLQEIRRILKRGRYKISVYQWNEYHDFECTFISKEKVHGVLSQALIFETNSYL
ncbi:Uncharacterised protein [Bartonella grahamii]|uniref:Uncharacterized protein n=1 Tax=Bartonella grahamii TaxID=33045 RepID=A0A336NE72_BARGR|nr:Uncharacterised protein [Bartonella grahamii]